MNLDYETLSSLKKVHPAWRLLDAALAPLIVSFLYRVYISENVRNISQIELISKLEDELFFLREVEGEEKYPRSAADYLEEWAQNDKGWLRKFYPAGSDEPSFDITSATEKVIGWLESLTSRKFVGTESRLMMVFELLRQMIEGTEVDPEKRIVELQKKKREIDAEIDNIRNGDVSRMSNTALRDRIQQVESTARDLLRDFREVENNFRQLDKEVRERIALWDGRKGELLEEILSERDAISSSDQGRSFQAFWNFLMSLSRQAELTEMLTKVLGFEAVKELKIDPRLKRIHYDWLEASNHTQRTVAKLSHQLRRYLDDKAYLENKRIIDILQKIQATAIEVRDNMPAGFFMEVDEAAATIALPFERPLFSPPVKPVIAADVVDADISDMNADVLFEQFVVDRLKLESQVNQLLQQNEQVSLHEVTKVYPVEKGLAELVTYFAIAADRGAVFDEERQEEISWLEQDSSRKCVHIPRIIFSR
ncbi:Protein of unknown function (DUF3375) [Desulfocapsa sulfexigens DSM 10523]|uniref:DUF3375 domain-containing protein n=1 Tax=Desulfocapsa sulfexigens (strain DSM 10523 / SB164P1) TaxID=1167006 RepID=M1PDI0_DESSD|nr:DUF3375 domain-containing protein [Desulfocapsa sulfexigens]AGF77790.1 Protein of unknown function (DUF3375) [Desulfocapsa sulfexigens DSM 10523]